MIPASAWAEVSTAQQELRPPGTADAVIADGRVATLLVGAEVSAAQQELRPPGTADDRAPLGVDLTTPRATRRQVDRLAPRSVLH